MRRNVVFRWLCLVGLLGASALAYADKQTVVVAVDDGYAPYTYSDKGAAAGIYVDMLKAVSNAMPHFAIEIRALPWKRALAEAEDGTVAEIVPPYKRVDVRPWMAYSEPLLVEPNVILCTKKVASKYKNAEFPAGFEGATFANNLGFLNPGPKFFGMVKAGKINLIEAKGTDQNLKKLEAERADCYMNERRVIAYEIEKNHIDSSKFTEVGMGDKEFAYLGYNPKAAKLASEDAFIKEFNSTLLQLRASKKIAPLE